MSPKSSLLLLALALAISLSLFGGYSLRANTATRSHNILVKVEAVTLIQLPDLALNTEVTWQRHRSLATPFAIFSEDGTLLDYYPASFTYKLIIPNIRGESP